MKEENSSDNFFLMFIFRERNQQNQLKRFSNIVISSGYVSSEKKDARLKITNMYIYYCVVCARYQFSQRQRGLRCCGLPDNQKENRKTRLHETK